VATRQTAANQGTLRSPNNSAARKIPATGVWLAAENTATKPNAAKVAGSRPKAVPSAFPRVAPTKKRGVTSPPLNPPLRQRAVSTSLTSQPQGWAPPSWNAVPSVTASGLPLHPEAEVVLWRGELRQHAERHPGEEGRHPPSRCRLKEAAKGLGHLDVKLCPQTAAQTDQKECRPECGGQRAHPSQAGSRDRRCGESPTHGRPRPRRNLRVRRAGGSGAANALGWGLRSRTLPRQRGVPKIAPKPAAIPARSRGAGRRRKGGKDVVKRRRDRRRSGRPRLRDRPRHHTDGRRCW
jgi:hypothetical protein